jgi:hypothetical protein
MALAPFDPKAAELEKQLKALLEVIKVDAAGNIEIKAKAKLTLSGAASVQITGAVVNVNNGALEVL